MYLATGNTIYSQSICSNTISEYLQAAADLITTLDPVEDRDPRKTDKGLWYVGIQKVINEVKRVETIPNRREGYTLAMHRRLFEKVRFLHKNSPLYALYDWCTVGLQGGFRRSEYCQSGSAGLLTMTIDLCAFGPKAFILADIIFFTASKVQLNRNFAVENPDDVWYVKVIFCWQKNGYHGIHRWMSRNDKRIYLCAVRAWIRIVARFLALMGESKSDCPLAVYYHRKTHSPRYVTSTMVTAEMRSLAVEVHHLTNKEDIDRFSSHSLRVGAACIYFAAGHDESFIQRVLRWESAAWKKYIRDLICTAVKAVAAMNTVDEFPLM